MKQEKFPNSRKPSHRLVCGEFSNLRGQHNREKKKTKNPTEYVPKHNCQWKHSPNTGPECPEDNLRELTGDSNPNCGIAREEKKKRENFHVKGSKAQPVLLTEQRIEPISQVS